MSVDLAPIAVFAYNRPDHLRRSIEALRANPEATDSDLILFSDAPLGEDDVPKVEAVRRYANSIGGFRSVRVEERDANLGGPVGIPAGVSDVVAASGRVVVVEDDMVVSPFHLGFVNRALDLYASEQRVVCISGYTFPHRRPLPETFFLRGALNHGWATWARSWHLFEPDAGRLLAELEARGLVSALDRRAYPYSEMLLPRPDKPVPPWDVRWYASAFLRGGLTLFPHMSLVNNIGFDGSGVHVGVGSNLDVPLANRPIAVEPIPVMEHRGAEAEFRRFLLAQLGAKRRFIASLPGGYRWVVGRGSTRNA